MGKLHLELAVLLGLVSSGFVLTQSPIGATPESTRMAVQANNRFACNLLRQLIKDKPGDNVFVSPWSIGSALALAMEGAHGLTAAQMGEVLGLSSELSQTGERPWKLDPHHVGFADLQRRCSGPRDAEKDQAIRAKLFELRQELQGLNAKIQQEVNKNVKADFKAVLEWQTQAQAKAATINQFQAQVDLFELNVANAIWGEKTFPFNPDYLAAVGRHYGTGLVREADFVNNFPAERLKINRWVEDQTRTRIKDLIPMLRPEEGALLRMILVNAIWFKGQWSNPFKKEATQLGSFATADGSKIQTALMFQYMHARYAAFQADGTHFATPKDLRIDSKEKTYPDGDGFLIAELPYKGGKLAMVVIVPQDPQGLPAIEAKLSGDRLAVWVSKLESFTVAVTLPRFKLETQYELSKTLQQLGMVDAFDGLKADFRGMAKSSNPEDKLHISRVIHKVFVEVNEEGTEAAAATAVLVSTTPPSFPRSRPFFPEFRADRPFLFLIREVDTGAVLFMGRMTTPAK